jgi:membrane protease YdiL (CAAX protease family)
MLSGLETHPMTTITDPNRPRWSPSAGLLGLLLALVGTAILSALLAGIYFAIGFNDLNNVESFQFLAIILQSAAFVGAALAMSAQAGWPTANQFGFRPFKRSAFGWALLALIVFLVLQTVYAVIANPHCDDLTDELGADKSTGLAVLTGFFVICVAPPVEEFFFRGFLYQSLRSRVGIFGGAAISGLVFGAIHFKPEFLVPLAILGFVLALLFEKTDSLWPCILLHSLYNSLAFAAAMSSTC